ncbi:MAG TPA: carbohydrate ABC transporter permease [Spirochaetia bacterium]|nr:carbohydrate ABC transporter permease [Spirochaetia bacterium]
MHKSLKDRYRSCVQILAKKKTRKEFIWTLVKTLVMGAFGIVMIMPFIWMISSSFKDSISMFRYPIEWIPKKFNFESYKDVWMRDVNFARFYLNSIKVTVITLVGTFFSCSMAAYAYAKIKFPGRDKLFLLKLSSTMIPMQVTMLPTFVIYKSLGLVNTHASLWLGSFFGGAFGVFLMRQFFITIPDELSEAAKMDGCSHYRIYGEIILPLAKPALATLLFIYFTWTWNDYEKPLLYLRTPGLYTLPLALKYFADENYTNYAAIMAAAVCMSLPVIVLFLFAQKYFIEGIASTGIKG